FADRRPGLDVFADDFDEQWKWIGSFDAWRAAMKVFLYPENVLDPALRQPQTPAFAQLVQHLRAKTTLTPVDACNEARSYAKYANDVGAIRVEASCQARAPLGTADCPGEGTVGTALFTFLFGRSQATGNVYMSMYRPGVATGYDQTFWTPIAEL